MPAKLFVGNLSFQATEEDLRELFQQAGTVESVRIVTDQFTGRPRGFGFVEMSTKEEATKAIEMLNGRLFRDRNLVVDEDLPARLEAELARMRRLPRAVSLCTATDPFQPFPSLLSVTYQAAEMLLRRGITVTFLTKGFIPEEFVALFSRFPDLVRARIGLLSLDPGYHRTFEPGTAPPEVRLGNLRRLRAAGIAAGVRHDPVIPGVTDKPEALARLFAALRKEGITSVDVGYLYIRPGIAQLLRDELPPAVARPLLSQFRSGPIEEVAASSHTQLLPPEIRVRSFFKIREAAREHGIVPILCRGRNPDMGADRCQGSRDLAYPVPRRRVRQLSLPLR